MSVWKTLNYVVCYGYAFSLIFSVITGIYIGEMREKHLPMSWWENEVLTGLSVGSFAYMMMYFCIPKRLRTWK